MTSVYTLPLCDTQSVAQAARDVVKEELGSLKTGVAPGGSVRKLRRIER